MPTQTLSGEEISLDTRDEQRRAQLFAYIDELLEPAVVRFDTQPALPSRVSPPSLDAGP
jgi:hypothetical protein